uniref:Uncharacterized protein n=1 Tax=Rhizophora mucronata TaxID=61149 RepID=A0A2P2PYV0_RHIMU
MADISKGII